MSKTVAFLRGFQVKLQQSYRITEPLLNLSSIKPPRCYYQGATFRRHLNKIMLIPLQLTSRDAFLDVNYHRKRPQRKYAASARAQPLLLNQLLNKRCLFVITKRLSRCHSTHCAIMTSYRRLITRIPMRPLICAA